jgi:hypothetical protein
MPVSFKRDMSAFSRISAIAILSEFYTGIVLIIQLPRYLNYASENPDKFKIDLAIFDAQFFKGCSIVFFAYTCSAQLFPIYAELISPTARRIKTVIKRAHAIDLAFYYMIALPGYFGTYDKTPNQVLDRLPVPGYQGTDYLFMVAQAL